MQVSRTYYVISFGSSQKEKNLLFSFWEEHLISDPRRGESVSSRASPLKRMRKLDRWMQKLTNRRFLKNRGHEKIPNHWIELMQQKTDQSALGIAIF